MKTCNDCIHCEACISQVPITFWDSETFYDGCKYFKDKSRFIELPCKVGDILCCESAIKGHITYFEAPDLAWIVENRELFGKEIFFSGEEAEKALKEREQNERL